MGDMVEKRHGTYRGQPYEVRVRLSYAEESYLYEYDTRTVTVRTRQTLLAHGPQADVSVEVSDSEPIEDYEETFLWWTLDSHEARPTEDHVEEVMEQFEAKIDERLGVYNSVNTNDE